MTGAPQPLHYRDLTAHDIAALRIMAEVEKIYPAYVPTPGKHRPSKVLAGLDAWCAKQRRAA